MKRYNEMLVANQKWVEEKLKISPDYFARMLGRQTPEFLWIGCSDSRVPAEDLTGAEPGEIFVHRNVANLVVHTDFNVNSVIQYAVEVLEVSNIIVCGHYGCGGIRAAMDHKPLGLINKWLRHIKDIYRTHQEELNSIAELQPRWDRLVELNVQEQIYNIAQTTFIQRAWKNNKELLIHGWVYDLKTGLIKDLYRMDQASALDPIDQYQF